MNDYTAPTTAIMRALGATGLDDVLALGAFDGLDVDGVADIVAGFGQLAGEVIAPSDAFGDAFGATLDQETGSVTVADAVGKAFDQWVHGGWPGFTAPAEFGGGGMPVAVGSALDEMFSSANLALSLNPMLSQGAIHLLEAWGTPEQQQRYLPALVTGRFTGTMNLTEPEAGSDVGALRTKAEPLDDGRWSITGTKIFITWGEHDLTENIIHLVLARTPGAPPGTRGISTFLVPAKVWGDDDSIGDRNGVTCIGLEHKLGIHSSPTCVLEFDGAIGEMIGPEHGGMAAMFTMMNSARLSVGLEGIGVGERAYQQAVAYAGERRQGRAVGADGDGPSPIIEHPDVRRMLLRMASGNEAMRLLLYRTAVANDLAHHADDEVAAEGARALADLLTPLAKAWSTDEGVRLASVAVQVFGGVGYVEETGVAQRYRDARIAPIYEGTNGIQAIDLVTRKVRRDGGTALAALVADLRADVDAAADLVADAVGPVRAALDALDAATAWLVAADTPDAVLAAASPYLDLASLAVCGGLYARAVAWSHAHESAEVASGVAGRFAFYAHERVSVAPALMGTITAGAAGLDAAFLP